MENEFKTNPALYRKLSEPFASTEAADTAASEFFRAVGELRKQYKIPDVYFMIGATWIASDGTEVFGYIPGGFGDAMQHEAMLAYALGKVQAERQEYIAKFFANAIKVRREMR